MKVLISHKVRGNTIHSYISIPKPTSRDVENISSRLAWSASNFVAHQAEFIES